MQLVIRIVVTVCLFFSVWLCVYGYLSAEAVKPVPAKAFLILFGIGSAGWIVYSIATLGRSRIE